MLLFSNPVLLPSNQHEIYPTFDLSYNIQTPTRFLIDAYVAHAFSFQLTNTEAEIIQKKINIKAKHRKGFVLFWVSFFGEAKNMLETDSTK